MRYLKVIPPRAISERGSLAYGPLTSALLLAPFSGLACGSSQGDSSSSLDAAPSSQPPAACALREPSASQTYPEGPYGIQVGEIFENFSLQDCDGNSVDFGNLLAQSEVTLFNIGAGWCAPCIEESETLDKDIFREFCGRGLRVVQVLFQDEQSRPATKFFCKQWREQFGLSFPVLVDPTFSTSKYFDSVSAQTPQNILISRSGEILFKETGTPAADLPQRIDAILQP